METRSKSYDNLCIKLTTMTSLDSSRGQEVRRAIIGNVVYGLEEERMNNDDRTTQRQTHTQTDERTDRQTDIQRCRGRERDAVRGERKLRQRLLHGQTNLQRQNTRERQRQRQREREIQIAE